MKRIIRAVLFVFLLPLLALAQEEEAPEPGFNEATFSGLAFRGIGPALMAGRIADIVIDPADPSTWYVGVGSGGIWKTVDGGLTWKPIFDRESTFAIGDLEVAPSDPNNIWVGTLNGVPGATITFTFTDAGEGGSADLADISIVPPGGGPPIVASSTLRSGNQQAHPDNESWQTRVSPFV